MTYGLYLSAAGANAQNHRLQVLSNNLANVETPGFKPQEAVLQARFAEAIERGDEMPGTTGRDDVGGGVTIRGAETQFSVGALRQTGNQTDFAISDPGAFFVVEEEGERMLTRAGNFFFDALGRLVTPQGQAVLASDGQPVQIDPTMSFDVVPGGVIQQGDFELPLMLARPTQLRDMQRRGDNQFHTEEFDLVNDRERGVVSGFVEQSAVSPTTAMMELIEASRVYEANVRMIQNQDHVMGSLISRVLQS